MTTMTTSEVDGEDSVARMKPRFNCSPIGIRLDNRVDIIPSLFFVSLSPSASWKLIKSRLPGDFAGRSLISRALLADLVPRSIDNPHYSRTFSLRSVVGQRDRPP